MYVINGMTQMPPECWQAWGIKYLTRKPVLTSEASLILKIFFLMSSLSWRSSGASLCHSCTYYHQLPRSRDWHLLHSFPPQGVAESNEVASRSPFLQSRQIECPQPLLTRRAFQPFYWLCCPPLNTLKDLNTIFILWRLETHTTLNIRQHQH